MTPHVGIDRRTPGLFAPEDGSVGSSRSDLSAGTLPCETLTRVVQDSRIHSVVNAGPKSDSFAG
jgi:hypothetical protein